ncbi:thioesterase family protein [Mesorhizobium sp. A623]
MPEIPSGSNLLRECDNRAPEDIVQLPETPSPDRRLHQTRLKVRPEWIDMNNHMNACYYLAIVKEPAMDAHNAWDYGDAFRKRTGQSNFVIGADVAYLRELLLGDEVIVTTRLTHVEDKRIHLLFEIFNATRNLLAALVQYRILHVRLGSPPKVAAMPADLKERLQEQWRLHRSAPLPREVERLKGFDCPRASSMDKV